MTEPPPPPQAHTEHVNAVFTRSGKSGDSPKTQKDPPPSIIVNNKIKKDKPIKTSKRDYQVVKTNEYPFHGGGGGETLGGGDSIEDEEVSLVDGGLEGALGALALEMEALVDVMDVDNG
ncbi:hypothetical protein Tco_0956209 [Tanacetum coccineum]|uniref:Uncharacterized protein n=1 Tax=Tanacetum coccineum TaxID=301880 RepID=A0ABQ5E9B7_9ASTR